MAEGYMIPRVSWSPEGFREVARGTRSSFRQIADVLTRQGYRYTEQAVSGWSREGSNGPRYGALIPIIVAFFAAQGLDSEEVKKKLSP